MFIRRYTKASVTLESISFLLYSRIGHQAKDGHSCTEGVEACFALSGPFLGHGNRPNFGAVTGSEGVAAPEVCRGIPGMPVGPRQSSASNQLRQFWHGRRRCVFLGGSMARAASLAIVGKSLSWGDRAAAAGVRTLVWSPPTPGLFATKE